MTEYLKLGKRGTLVIPAEMRRRLGLDEGALVAMEESGGSLTLTPVVVHEVEVYTPERQAEFLLNNAVTAEEFDGAVAVVREMGIDPDSIPHQPRPEE